MSETTQPKGLNTMITLRDYALHLLLLLGLILVLALLAPRLAASLSERVKVSATSGEKVKVTL